LDLESKKYNPTSQGHLLHQLNEKYPNNAEQDEVYNYIKTKIDNLEENDPGTFIFINGPAGITTITIANNTIITTIILNDDFVKALENPLFVKKVLLLFYF
jgi:hypothetical protein